MWSKCKRASAVTHCDIPVWTADLEEDGGVSFDPKRTAATTNAGLMLRSLGWALLIAGIMFLGTVAPRKGLTEDETMSLRLAQRPWPNQIWESLHPPLYYTVLGAWISAFGERPMSLNSLGVTIAILLAFSSTFLAFCVSDDFDWSLAVGASVLLIPMVTWGTLMARNYALCAVWLTISTGLFVRILRDQATARTWSFYVLSTVAALYTFYFSLFLIAAQGIMFVVWHLALHQGRRSQLWRWCASQFAVAALFAPQAAVMISIQIPRQATAAHSVTVAPDIQSIFRALVDPLVRSSPLGGIASITSPDPRLPTLALACFYITILISILPSKSGRLCGLLQDRYARCAWSWLMAVGLLYGVLVCLNAEPTPRMILSIVVGASAIVVATRVSPRNRPFMDGPIVLVVLATMTVGLAIVAYYVFGVFFGYHYLITIAPVMSVFAFAVARVLQPGYAKYTLAALLSLSLLMGSIQTRRSPQWGATHDAAAVIKARLMPGEVIITTAGNPILSYYGIENVPMYCLPLELGGAPVELTETNLEKLEQMTATAGRVTAFLWHPRPGGRDRGVGLLDSWADRGKRTLEDVVVFQGGIEVRWYEWSPEPPDSDRRLRQDQNEF